MTTIFINSVERESEKAMLLNVNVSYNANTPKPRSIWFPKSVIESINDSTAKVKDWFIAKTEQSNAFATSAGGKMRIEIYLKTLWITRSTD